jgi:hypothetical protein
MLSRAARAFVDQLEEAARQLPPGSREEFWCLCVDLCREAVRREHSRQLRVNPTRQLLDFMNGKGSSPKS